MLQLANGSTTTLSTGITAIQTTITVVDGSIFPVLTLGNWFPVTITEGATSEIIRVTGVSGDDFTVERGSEGTTGLVFTSAATCKLSLTSDSLVDMMINGVSSDTAVTVEKTTQGRIDPSTSDLTAGLSFATEFKIAVDCELESVTVYLNGVGTFFVSIYELISGVTYENIKEVEVTATDLGETTFSTLDGSLSEVITLKPDDVVGVRIPAASGVELAFKGIAGGVWVEMQNDTGEGDTTVTWNDNTNGNYISLQYTYKVSTPITGSASGATETYVDNAINEAVIKMSTNYNLRPLDTTELYMIGDSTVAAFAGGAAIYDLLGTIRLDQDLSVAGNNISQQTTAWNTTTIVDNIFGYVTVQIGLNDMAPAEAATVALARLQLLIDTIRTDIGADRKIIICQMTPARQRWIDLYGGVDGLTAQQKWEDMNEAIMGLGANPITDTDYQVDAHVALMGDELFNLLPEYDTGDGIHPNTAGRQVNADAMIDVIRGQAGFVV